MNTKYKDWSEEIGNLWRHLRGILSASEAIALRCASSVPVDYPTIL